MADFTHAALGFFGFFGAEGPTPSGPSHASHCSTSCSTVSSGYGETSRNNHVRLAAAKWSIRHASRACEEAEPAPVLAPLHLSAREPLARRHRAECGGEVRMAADRGVEQLHVVLVECEIAELHVHLPC